MCDEFFVINLTLAVVLCAFNPTDYEVMEGETVMVTIELIGQSDIDVVVDLATQDLTARGKGC